MLQFIVERNRAKIRTWHACCTVKHFQNLVLQAEEVLEGWSDGGLVPSGAHRHHALNRGVRPQQPTLVHRHAGGVVGQQSAVLRESIFISACNVTNNHASSLSNLQTFATSQSNVHAGDFWGEHEYGCNQSVAGRNLGLFFVIDRIFFKDRKKLGQFGHDVWKGRLVSTVTARWNKWPKSHSEKWNQDRTWPLGIAVENGCDKIHYEIWYVF